MKVTFKDINEATEHLKAQYNGLIAKGIKAEDAAGMIADYLEKNEFVNNEGHVLKLSLGMAKAEHDEPDGDEGVAKAIGAAVKSAMADVVAGIKGATKVNGGGDIDVKEDWERLLEDKKWGFKNLGEQAQAIFMANHPNMASKRVDDRLSLISKADKALTKRFEAQNKATPSTFASELVGADGGFAVAPEFREEIVRIITQEESILPLTDNTPTNSNTVVMPVDEVAPWNNSQGIITYWRAQGTTMSQSKVALQQRIVQLQEVYALVPATEELLADAPRLNSFLSVKAPQKLGFQIDASIFRGNGSSQPLGFLTSSAPVTVTRNTTTDIKFADIANMLGRFYSGNNSNNGVWFVSPSALVKLIQLNSGGSQVSFPIALSQQTVEGKVITTLFGKPLIVSQHCSALGTTGDIILADLKGGYASFTKTDGLDFQSSIHLFFDSGSVAFRWRFRVGGQPYLTQPFAQANDNTNTLSHYVKLSTL